VESSCECGNEPSGSLKCWEVLEWLHNWWPLDYYSAPYSYYLNHWVMHPVARVSTNIVETSVCNKCRCSFLYSN
jgi:hypothetical protein